MVFGLASELALVLALADAAVSDVRSFRIPNRSSLVVVGAFAIAALVSGQGGGLLLSHGAAAVVVFLGAAALFFLGVWGGGDVKLLAAVSLWAGFEGLLRLLLVMSLAGGVLAIAVLLLRCLPADNKTSFSLWRGRVVASGYVPYGVAIAAGGIDWLLQGHLPAVPA